jgi:hypothetical protein
MAARFIGFNPLAGFIVAIVFVLEAVFSTLPVRADFRILSSCTSDTQAFKRAIDMTDDELAAIAARAKLTVV